MIPQYHFLISFFLALIFLWFTKSLMGSLIVLASGSLLDLDHLFDFWLYKGKIVIDREILEGFYVNFNKIPVVLHSIELLIPLWIFGYFSGYYLFSVAISLGFISHLILDFLSYELYLPAYSFLYRLSVDFVKSRICKDIEI